MQIETLIATMNLVDHGLLLQDMNVVGESVTINQITDKLQKPAKNSKEHSHRLLSYYERGLSRSRNRAIENAIADICVIADDDMRYVDNYLEIIKKGFDIYEDADVIAFRVDNPDGKPRKQLQEGKIDFLHSMKLCSVQLAFRLSSLRKHDLRFREDFGAGTDIFMGEENILLAECLRKGLKIYAYPEKIAMLCESESTWFNGYTPDYFIVRGKVFRRMSLLFCIPLSLQFVVRKRNLYKDYLPMRKALLYILKGVYAGS